METFQFESYDVYKLASKIGELVWQLTSKWNDFEKQTLGKQLVRSADSISLNICEGYGRFHYRDRKLFYYYSRGSLYETYESLKKANNRKLISEEEFKSIAKIIKDFAVRLNNYISSTNSAHSKAASTKTMTPSTPGEAALLSE